MSIDLLMNSLWKGHALGRLAQMDAPQFAQMMQGFEPPVPMAVTTGQIVGVEMPTNGAEACRLCGSETYWMFQNRSS
jgi:hypothetical protein